MAVTRLPKSTAKNNVRGQFHTNVFINCPFDNVYKPLLRSLLFTIVYLGLNPRLALESKNSGTPRIDKIVQLIRESQYAIHDLSRSKAKKKGELFRHNMPFELGLDIGCLRYASGRLKNKKSLILDSESYQYQAALSDLAGSDITTGVVCLPTAYTRPGGTLHVEAVRTAIRD